MRDIDRPIMPRTIVNIALTDQGEHEKFSRYKLELRFDSGLGAVFFFEHELTAQQVYDALVGCQQSTIVLRNY